MTENFQNKLHQEECKQSKGTKICANIIKRAFFMKKGHFFAKRAPTPPSPYSIPFLSVLLQEKSFV